MGYPTLEPLTRCSTVYIPRRHRISTISAYINHLDAGDEVSASASLFDEDVSFSLQGPISGGNMQLPGGSEIYKVPEELAAGLENSSQITAAESDSKGCSTQRFKAHLNLAEPIRLLFKFQTKMETFATRRLSSPYIGGLEYDENNRCIYTTYVKVWDKEDISSVYSVMSISVTYDAWPPEKIVDHRKLAQEVLSRVGDAKVDFVGMPGAV